MNKNRIIVTIMIMLSDDINCDDGNKKYSKRDVDNDEENGIGNINR